MTVCSLAYSNLHSTFVTFSFVYSEIEWSALEYFENLVYFDISNNSFDGIIELSYFKNCINLQYFSVAFNQFGSLADLDQIESVCELSQQLTHFLINNNDIIADIKLEYFSKCGRLEVLKCNNNSLAAEYLDMSNIPQSLTVFECGNNDFGEFIWDPQPYDEYLLEIVELTNTRIYGSISMQFFDHNNGGFSQLASVDLSNNDNLNISIDFEYLNAQLDLYYLNLLKCDTHGFVNFDYLPDSTNITGLYFLLFLFCLFKSSSLFFYVRICLFYLFTLTE